MGLEPRQDGALLLFRYGPENLLRLSKEYVHIKTVAAKYLRRSASTGMEVCTQREHMYMNEWTIRSSKVQFESVGGGHYGKCERTPDWIPMLRH